MPHTSDITLLYLIKQVELAVRSQLDEAVAAEGLTSLQYTALTVLERHPGITSAALARNSFVRAQTMAQMTAYLEGLGLIRRASDPGSKRQIQLFLSERGVEVLVGLRPRVAEVEARMIGGLSDAAVRDYRAALLASRVALGGKPAR